MSSQEPVWQVNIDGQVFEADLETLKRWISEGRVLATDSVRKGVSVGSQPTERLLCAACSRKPGFHRPVPFTSPPAETPLPLVTHSDTTSVRDSFAPETAADAPARHGASVCHNHPDRSPIYSCRICGKTFCGDCPQFVGSSRIPTCPACGDLCVPIDEGEVEEVNVAGLTRKVDLVSAVQITSSFGLSDFVRALQYPLKSPLGLVGIAAFYGFLQLGGFKTQLIAFALLFGCLASVIKQVAWGRFDRSFLPEFNDFSFADDVIGPAVLGLGTTVVTFGPFLMLVLAMLSGWIGGAVPAGLTPRKANWPVGNLL